MIYHVICDWIRLCSGECGIIFSEVGLWLNWKVRESVCEGGGRQRVSETEWVVSERQRL